MTLTEHEGKTTLTLRGSPIRATPEEHANIHAGRESMRRGFTGTLDQLGDYLARQIR